MELKLKKCSNCGALVKVINDCHCKCSFICCDNVMDDVIPNSVDAAFEKHIPNYDIEGDTLKVSVNHVMDEDHYIEWLAFVNDEKEEFVYLKPGAKAECTFKYQNGTLYAYCNKHGLWMQEV